MPSFTRPTVKKIERVLLLAAPAVTFRNARDINPMPPMGLGYLASALEGMGITVEILDCLMEGWGCEEELSGQLVRVGLSYRDIARRIVDHAPDIVGINCQFSRQNNVYHELFQVVKGAKPDVTTIAGGAHATVCPKEMLQNTACDYVLIGEADRSLPDLLKQLMNGGELAEVDGLGWKMGSELHINEKVKWVADIDTIPYPAYHLMGLERYFGLKASHGERHRNRFSPIVTSRGCPARCTFCSAHRVWGKKYRVRTVDNVIKEMRLLHDRYGVEEILFEDDNVTANRKRATELFDRMKGENFNFVWDTPNGVGAWSIDEEMLDAMKASGCLRVNFPVESGSQWVLDTIIKKPLDLGHVRRMIAYCRKIDLEYGMFLVIGMPGETMRDIWMSFRYAASCGCFKPHISVATPYPGTELYDICRSNGYLSRDVRMEDYYIRSFLIKTPQWSERRLAMMLTWGRFYLAIRGLLAGQISPRVALKAIVNRIRQMDQRGQKRLIEKESI